MSRLVRLGLRLGALLALAASGTAIADEGFPLSEDDLLVREGRMLIAREHPEVLRHVFRNDGFGGPSSPLIARAMLNGSPAHVAAAREAMQIERHGKGMWLLRFPYVNVALIETQNGLILFDTGYASIGTVLAETIPTLSDKPLTHIVVSHVHVDHAYGWPALKAKWPEATTITSDLFPAMAAKEVRLGGSIGRYNNQPLELQPTSTTRLPSPDIVFRDRLSLEIDGERFELFHAPAETEEQIWMHAPARGAIFTADYYQGFLPNAGNGKRIMRHIDEWAAALRHMAGVKPEFLLPMHNAALTGNAQIVETLELNAEALEYVSRQVVAGLNAGERPDVIAADLNWPVRFANDPRLDPQYNRPADIARMVARRWTGWWDDIPSHFAPMRFEDEAREAIRLAGGLDKLDARARELLAGDTVLAARLADWAYFGAPDDPRALRLTVDVYLAMMAMEGIPLQEASVYLEHAARARARLEKLS
ncbi:MAG: MBL fold metallo-hydrolase, partial [Novosphingobium sp.]|nr:MBL fold metallo-hydrolase [Novosphingobium sp.]